MMNFINLLAGYTNFDAICDDLAPVLRLVGIVIKAIQIGVPIILIVIGIMDFAKAVTEKKDDSIKDAEKKLINRAIAAACVFFVVLIVSLLMTLIGNKDYEACMDCINHPFGKQCPANTSSGD